jgi:cytochrome c oxidase assembly factor CtaG
LTPVAFILTGCAWLSFLVLGRAALRRPRIGALTERAFIAFVIAALGTVSCLIVMNTDNGHAFFPVEVASLLFRLAIIAVLAVPTLWLALWTTGQLGQADR